MQEIEELKKAQEELKTKTIEEITELKKETNRLIVEKAHLFDSWVQVEVVVADACKHVNENTTKLDAVMRDKWLGEIIVQLQKDNNILNALFYPNTPLEQISKRKTTIEEVVAQLEELE